jgi:putative membrane protein
MSSMGFIATTLVNGLAVFITAYLLPGVQVENYLVALIVAVVLALINTLIKPIIILFTLPVTIITFGLFVLVINAVLVMIVANIVPGFEVVSFGWALLFGLILSIVNALLSSLVK